MGSNPIKGATIILCSDDIVVKKVAAIILYSNETVKWDQLGSKPVKGAAIILYCKRLQNGTILVAMP